MRRGSIAGARAGVGVPDPSPEEFSRALFSVVDLLESLGAPHLIFGAVAVGIWGRIRATLDVDFLVQTDEDGLSRLGAAAESAGLAVDQQWLDWNPLRRGVHLRLLLEPFRADVVRTIGAHDDAALERRRQVSWRGRSLWVVSPEDLILQKIRAQRDYDFSDAVSIVEEQAGRLDEGYLDVWARRLGVEQELAYILRGGPAG